MFNNSNIQQMVNLAKKAALEMRQEIHIFDEIMKETIKGVPDDQKQKVEELRALSIKAYNLAKMGRADEAKEIVKKFQNGRKSTKEGL